MESAVRKRVVVQAGGRIEIVAPELPPGAEAEVIILLRELGGSRPRSLASLVGAGKGAFGSPEEADAFIRRERGH